jgi:hypothetical protein
MWRQVEIELLHVKAVTLLNTNSILTIRSNILLSLCLCMGLQWWVLFHEFSRIGPISLMKFSYKIQPSNYLKGPIWSMIQIISRHSKLNTLEKLSNTSWHCCPFFLHYIKPELIKLSFCYYKDGKFSPCCLWFRIEGWKQVTIN